MAQIAKQCGSFDPEVKLVARQHLCDCDNSWLPIWPGTCAGSLQHLRKRGSVAQQGENHRLCVCTTQTL